MRIVCPACESEYDVPDSVAGTGRKVRCARCQTVWLAAEGATAAAPHADAPPPAFAAAVAAAEREPPAPDEDAAPDGFDTAPLVADPPLGGQARAGRRPPGSALAALEAGYEHDARPGLHRLAPWMAAWVLSLAVVGAAAWAGYHWRTEVMRVWPASERLYAMLGPVAEPPPQHPDDARALNPGPPHRPE